MNTTDAFLALQGADPGQDYNFSIAEETTLFRDGRRTVSFSIIVTSSRLNRQHAEHRRTLEGAVERIVGLIRVPNFEEAERLRQQAANLIAEAENLEKAGRARA